MKTQFHSVIVLALLSFVCCAGEWQKIDKQLGTSRLKGVWCLPQKGRVICFAGGLMLSDDGGTTWKKTGRSHSRFSYTGMSCSVDVEGNRLAMFFAGKESKLSLDGGETWQEIKSITNQGLSWGAVAWHDGAPFTMITREHHAHPGDSHWISHDSGQTWTLLGKHVKMGRERPRLAIWDRKTILRGGEKKIERSTDGGKTWNKVADYKVNACAGVRYDDTLYWTTNEGVIVSHDKGATWQILGTAIANASWGPFFGKDQNEIVIINDKGAQRTVDGGKTWTQIAPYPDMPKGYSKSPWNEQCRFAHFAYDPVHQCLYAAGLFGSLWQYKLEK